MAKWTAKLQKGRSIVLARWCHCALPFNNGSLDLLTFVCFGTARWVTRTAPRFKNVKGLLMREKNKHLCNVKILHNLKKQVSR